MNNQIFSPLTEYAGFWRRFMATLIDSVWMVLLIAFLMYLINPSYFSEFDSTPFPNDWKEIVVNDIIPLIIVVALWYRYSATPGKWLLDCEIVDANTGNPIGLTQAIVRYIAYIVSAIPLGLGFLWILWDKRKQGWHDKIARTVVIVHDDATIPLEKLAVQGGQGSRDS